MNRSGEFRRKLDEIGMSSTTVLTGSSTITIDTAVFERLLNEAIHTRTAYVEVSPMIEADIARLGR